MCSSGCDFHENRYRFTIIIDKTGEWDEGLGMGRGVLVRSYFGGNG